MTDRRLPRTRGLGPLLVALLAAGLLLPGCGDATPGAAGSGDDLDGRTFRSTQVQGHQLVAGTRVQLSFADDRLSASAGCNQFSGGYTVDGGTLRVSGLGGREMGCDPERAAQDEWLVDFLTSAPSIAVAGARLDLETAESAVRLHEAVDLPLTGTTWRLDGLVTGDAVSSLPEGATATIRVEGSGAQPGATPAGGPAVLAVDTGCRTGTAQVTVAPEASAGSSTSPAAGTWTLTAVDLADGDCAPGARAVDRHLVHVLSGTVEYAIHLESLALTRGSVGATFVGEPAG
jgi:heat shock protein HslJ